MKTTAPKVKSSKKAHSAKFFGKAGTSSFFQKTGISRKPFFKPKPIQRRKIQRKQGGKGDEQKMSIVVTDEIKMVKTYDLKGALVGAYVPKGYGKNDFTFEVYGGMINSPARIEVTTTDGTVVTRHIGWHFLDVFSLKVNVVNTGPLKNPPYELIHATDRAPKKFKIAETIHRDFNLAVDKVKRLTGIDLGLDFGNIFRQLSHGGGNGSDAFSWHKTGRAVDFDQGKFGKAIFEPESRKIGDETRQFWKIYLPYKDNKATIDQIAEADRKYIKTFSDEEVKATKYKTGKPRKVGGVYPLHIDFRSILHEYGFHEIPAHRDWKSNQKKQEWWHFEKRGGLTWWQAMLEVHSREEVIKKIGPIVKGNRTRWGGRLKREGAPNDVLREMAGGNVSKIGAIALIYAVGDPYHSPNLSEDVSAVRKAMHELGYEYPKIKLLDKLYLRLRGQIVSFQKAMKLKEREYVSPGDGTHSKLANTLKNKVTKGQLTLYASVGEGLVNLPVDVRSIKKAFNEGFKQGKFPFMQSTIPVEGGEMTPALLQLIEAFNNEFLKSTKPDRKMSKGGTTHDRLGNM